MTNYPIPRGHTLFLDGPVQFRLRSGSATSLGAPIPSDDWAFVGRRRRVPVYAAEASALEVKFGPGSARKEVQGSTIPASWIEASDVLRQSPGTVIIIGGVDSGKSSLCTFLTNEGIRHGFKVAVIDADVGQADIGPPTTVSSANVRDPVLGLQDLRPERSFFIGDTSPSSAPRKLIQSVDHLKRNLGGAADIVIVNTDGWVGDAVATSYKSQLLTETKPDLVLGLTQANEIDPLFDLAPGTILRLESSSSAMARTKEDRKKAREAGYQRFLHGSKPLRIETEEVRFRMFDQPQQTVFTGSRNFRGLLVGLLNAEDSLIAIGRLREFRGGAALVETQANVMPEVLELGAVVLSSKYEEAGYAVLH